MNEIPLTHAGATPKSLADVLSPAAPERAAGEAGAAPTIFASLLEQAHETGAPSARAATASKGSLTGRSEIRAQSSLTRQTGGAPRTARKSTPTAAKLATAGSRPLTERNAAATAATKPPRSAPLGKTKVALPIASSPALSSSFPGAKTTNPNNRNPVPAPSQDASQKTDADLPSAALKPFESNQESEIQPLPLGAPEKDSTATAQNQETNWPVLGFFPDSSPAGPFAVQSKTAPIASAVSLAQPVLATPASVQARISATPKTGAAPDFAPIHASQPVAAESVPVQAPRLKHSTEADESGAPTRAVEQPLPGSAKPTSVANAAAAAPELATPDQTHAVDLFSSIQSPDSSQSSSAPMIGADGMSAALLGDAMQKMPDVNENSAPAEQNLPIAAASFAFTRSSERDRKADLASPSVRATSTSTTTVLPSALSGPMPAPIASSATGAQMTSGGLAHRSIEDLILSFPRQDSRSVSVILTPDANTQLSVHVKMQQGHLQAQAVLDRGDFGALKADWANLQSRLADHGVRLAALTSGTDSQSPFGSGSSLSHHQQRDVQSENDVPSQNANKPQTRPSTAPAATAHRREWWA